MLNHKSLALAGKATANAAILRPSDSPGTLRASQEREYETLELKTHLLRMPAAL
jgi:hypothetical protein